MIVSFLVFFFLLLLLSKAIKVEFKNKKIKIKQGSVKENEKEIVALFSILANLKMT